MDLAHVLARHARNVQLFSEVLGNDESGAVPFPRAKRREHLQATMCCVGACIHACICIRMHMHRHATQGRTRHARPKGLGRLGQAMSGLLVVAQLCSLPCVQHGTAILPLLLQGSTGTACWRVWAGGSGFQESSGS